MHDDNDPASDRFAARKMRIRLVGEGADLIDAIARHNARIVDHRAAHDLSESGAAAPCDACIIDWRGVADPAALAAWLLDLPSDCPLLIVTDLDGVDAVFALGAPRGADFLIGEDAFERDLAIAELCTAAAPRLGEDNAEEERARLRAMAVEIARIAERLSQLSADDAAAGRLGDPSTGYTPPGGDDAKVTAIEVRRIIALRRLRDRYFAAGLFADPAWDMLLDLFAARLERVNVSVSSLCIAAAVPPTTALRWIKLMTDQALLEREADPHDARRIFITLSKAAAEQVRAYLVAARAQAGPIV